MINDNLIANKLNSYKNNKSEISEPLDIKSEKPVEDATITQAINGFVFILEFFKFLCMSIIFGFAFKTVFQTDWRFWGLLCVGLSTNYIINSIIKLFNK